jgi:hypothetical protein
LQESGELFERRRGLGRWGNDEERDGKRKEQDRRQRTHQRQFLL